MITFVVTTNHAVGKIIFAVTLAICFLEIINGKCALSTTFHQNEFQKIVGTQTQEFSDLDIGA